LVHRLLTDLKPSTTILFFVQRLLVFELIAHMAQTTDF